MTGSVLAASLLAATAVLLLGLPRPGVLRLQDLLTNGGGPSSTADRTSPRRMLDPAAVLRADPSRWAVPSAGVVLTVAATLAAGSRGGRPGRTGGCRGSPLVGQATSARARGRRAPCGRRGLLRAGR
jgi:hypothetical protein